MKSTAATTFAVVTLGLALNAQAVDIYDNSVNDQTSRLEALNGLWFGDEVVLAGTERFLTGFDFQFWATNTSGATVDIRLYQNDGALFNGYASPGTVVYELLGFGISDTSRSTLNFSAADLDLFDGNSDGGTLFSGNNLTLAVRFNFAGGEAGVDLYNPPVVGSGFDDYWQLNGSTWELTTNNTFSVVNFGMTVQAVPEPSAISLAFMGGLALLGFRRFLIRK